MFKPFYREDLQNHRNVVKIQNMMEKMKSFLYLIEADLTSGASLCAAELVKRLKDTDFKPIVVTQHKNDFNDFCDKIGVENYHFHYARICSLGMGKLGWLIAFFLRPFFNFITFKRLKQKINLNAVSFVHSNGASIDFGAYLHKKIGIPHLWHIRDFFLFDKKWPPLVKDLPCYMSKNATKIITVSKALEKYLTNNGCPQNKVQTIYDGVAVPFKSSRRSCSETKKDVINVVCVGQICQPKGQMVLIDAILKMTEDERTHFKVVFFGDIKPDVKKELAVKMNESKLDQCVEFKGYSKNILSNLTNYDIGVQPSHSEGFSRVTAEYMATGLCILAADEGAIPELIQHKENGLLYEDFNSNDLKEKLLYCYNNQESMCLFGIKAQTKFFDNYELSINLKKLLELYNHYSG